MKKFVKLISLVLALLMVVAVFAACDNGDKDNREPQEPSDHNAYCPSDVLCRTYACLCAHSRSILPQKSRAGASGTLCPRNHSRNHRGKGDEPVLQG